MWCVCILDPVMGSCILIGVGSVCIWIIYSTVRDIVDVYDWLRIFTYDNSAGRRGYMCI